MSIKKYKNPVLLGIFVSVGIVLFLLSVLTIGSQHKFFVKSFRLRVVFEDVNGLQTGNNVWLSGMKIGTVKRLAFCSGHRVEVTLNVGSEALGYIRKDAVAKVSSDGLIGNRIVVIGGGSDSAGGVADNDLLRVVKTVGTDDMLAMLQENNKNLLVITGQFKEIGQKINDGKGIIGLLLNDERLADKLGVAVSGLKQASVNTDLLTSQIKEFAYGLNKPGSLPHDLVTDTFVLQRLRLTMTQLEDASGRISDFATEIRNAGGDLERANGPAGLLLRDTGVASDLRMTISQLRSGSELLSEDLEALQHNFLLKGYFKRKAKAAQAKTTAMPSAAGLH